MNPVEPTAHPPPPSVPSLVARLFTESPVRVRQKLVACLLGTAGPLALASLADGRFARFLLRPPTEALVITLAEARRLTEGQVLALANYAWQASPAVFQRVVELLQAENPTMLRSFTGVLLLFALGERARRKSATRPRDLMP